MSFFIPAISLPIVWYNVNAVKITDTQIAPTVIIHCSMHHYTIAGVINHTTIRSVKKISIWGVIDVIDVMTSKKLISLIFPLKKILVYIYNFKNIISE